MNKENTKKLLEAFPKLYRQYYLSPQESCMHWGFDCPDEWFPVIYELSEKITTYMNEKNILIEASQVKEKFGGLRFYIDYKSEVSNEDDFIIYEFISDAEAKVDEIDRNLGIERM